LDSLALLRADVACRKVLNINVKRKKLNPKKFNRRLVIGTVAVLVAATAGVVLLRQSDAASTVVGMEAEVGAPAGVSRIVASPGASGGKAVRMGMPEAAPTLRADVLVSGKKNIWDIVFLPDGPMLFTERAGVLGMYRYDTKQVSTLTMVPDVKAAGEGGLMGMVLDPDFSTNRYIYFCHNSTSGSDVRVVRYRLPADLSGLQDKREIITGITSNTNGRHSGCRTRFGTDGYLWVTTGDAAVAGTLQQSPTSLNGKILRVNRDGQAAPGNYGNGFDARIFSYGHRNVQGLAFFPAPMGGVPGISVEHGSSIDDEVNVLKSGNFGWATPAGSYDESGVPMTDLQRFPNAIQAIWSSGSPTQAPSGAAILSGPQWKGWDGAVAIGMLKAEHLKILRLDATNKVIREERRLEGTYDRLRSPVFGPDGNLYLTTGNGGEDKIIRLTPE
jgi:glucose/arabinose dehydrogenase